MRVSTVLSFGLLATFASAFIINGNSRRVNLPLHQSEYVLEARSITVDRQRKEDLVTLLPPRKQMTKLEVEFREMLEAMIFAQRNMTAITDARLRALYEGVAASYYEPAVYRAFEVLYEDCAPLRVAGRVIHQKLTSIMKESLEYKSSQILAVQTFSTFSEEQIESFWSLFVQFTNSRELSIEDAKEYLLMEHLEDLVGSKGLSFEGLMFFYKDMPSEVILQKLQEAVSTKSTMASTAQLDEKRRKHSERYDEMLVQFAEWKEFIPDGEGRRLDILRGCFVGSENPKVVEALKIIYVDYTALRMSGNWIFRLVSALMSRVMRP